MGRAWLQGEAETKPCGDARTKMQLQAGGVRLQGKRVYRHFPSVQEIRPREKLRIRLLNFPMDNSGKGEIIFKTIS